MRFLLVGLMALGLLLGCDSRQAEISRHLFGFESIVSFDLEQRDGRAHLLVAGSTDGRTHIHYTWSDDGGRSWATPVAVDADAPTPHGLGHGSDVQIAASGDRLVAVWPAAGDGWGGNGPLASALSVDGGKHWQPGPRPASGFGGGQGYADVTLGATGDFHLVWLDSRNGEQALYHAQSADGGEHWTAPGSIDGATCFCCSNELALAADGDLLALFRDAQPRDMFLTRLADDATWQRRGVVGDFGWEFNGCPEVGGSLVATRDGLHALVWTGKEGAAGVYHLASANKGKTWSEPQRLAGPGSRNLALAASDAKHLAAAWKMTTDNASGVALALSEDGGKTWAEREALFTGDSHPRLVATDGGWLLVMFNQQQALAIARM